MLRRIFDLNRTVKHVSYKEMKARYERDMKRSDLFFRVVLWVSGLIMFALIVAHHLVR